MALTLTAMIKVFVLLLLPPFQWMAVTAAAASDIAHFSSVQFLIETLSSRTTEVDSTITTSKLFIHNPVTYSMLPSLSSF